MARKERTTVLPGSVFGELEVIEQVPRTETRDLTYTCKCSCGRIKNVAKQSLVTGATKSCGCLHRRISREVNTRHGLSKERIYRIWNGMIQRCDNKNVRGYKYYGGRGITYSDEFSTFEGFYLAMGDSYEPELTLDRRDVDGNYTRNNCRWVGYKTQANNKRNNRRIKDPLSEDVLTLAGLSDRYELDITTLFDRLERGDSGENLIRGARLHQRRLSDDEVREIKVLLLDYSAREVSEMLGIQYNTITAIRRGDSYGHILDY